MPKKVLLVDDDETMLDLLEIFFSSYHCSITKAIDGEMAIKALRTADYDLVITDLQMGWISGLDVVREAKAIRLKTLVFMITGCDDGKSALEAFRLGADDYLLKPFSFRTLIERLKKKAFFPEKSRGAERTRFLSGCFTAR